MTIRTLIAILLLAIALPASATYKWTKPDGTVVFSDEPPHPDAEEIKLKLTPTIPATKVPPPPPKKKETREEEEEYHYTSLTFSAPLDDETVFENNGNVTVRVIAEPPLNNRRKHKFIFELDEEPREPAELGDGEETEPNQFTLPGIDRGTHTLRAHIIDANENILISSKAIQFHLRRFSRLHRSR